MTTQSITSYYSVQTYHDIVQHLRQFFISRGYIEVDSQSQQHVLAACEDPKTVSLFQMTGNAWPLPQTGQMWLEQVLLNHPELHGVFCLTTSYRDEPSLNHTRHLRMFPLFEFESQGDMETLQETMIDLFETLGLGPRETYCEKDYEDVASHYNVSLIEAEEEHLITHDFSHVFFLKNFPYRTHPFFNMRRNGNVAKKIDAILYGMETVGSAERSCNPKEMWEDFLASSDGEYSQLLFNKFGKERVVKELEDYLSLPFIPRCGGGIGLHRLFRALQMHNALTIKTRVV